MSIETTLLSLLLVLSASVACAQPSVDQTPPVKEPTLLVETVPVARADPKELLRNGRMPAEGILTGGQPTPEQLETLAGLGYRTVINLRSSTESGSTDPAAVESLGMTYVSIPVAGATDVSVANARRLAEALSTADYPVVVHCGSGNRVGALFALKAFYIDGQHPEDALALGRAAGVTGLEPAVKEQLGLE